MKKILALLVASAFSFAAFAQANAPVGAPATGEASMATAEPAAPAHAKMGKSKTHASHKAVKHSSKKVAKKKAHKPSNAA